MPAKIFNKQREHIQKLLPKKGDHYELATAECE